MNSASAYGIRLADRHCFSQKQSLATQLPQREDVVPSRRPPRSFLPRLSATQIVEVKHHVLQNRSDISPAITNTAMLKKLRPKPLPCRYIYSAWSTELRGGSSVVGRMAASESAKKLIVNVRQYIRTKKVMARVEEVAPHGSPRQNANGI
jgi:hypothetical protein